VRFAGRFAFSFGGEEGPVAATFENLGYEVAGAAPGDADAWTWTSGMADELVAIWGTGAPRADQEDFESEWSSNEGYLFAFEDGDLLAPTFDSDVSDGEGFEDFEEGWGGVEHYHFALPATATALFDSFSPEAVEDFEEEWDGNEGYDLTLGAATLAEFDAGSPQEVEDFEEEWSGNEAYDFTLGAATAASFDDGGTPEDVEDFEETYQDLQVVVDPSTDLFTASGSHGLSAGDLVTFRLVGPGALPAGINASFVYHVIAGGLTATDFKVSVAAGGSAANVTDAGAGTFYVRGDATAFWRLDA